MIAETGAIPPVEQPQRRLGPLASAATATIAVLTTLFFLYTAYEGSWTAVTQRSLLLSPALALIFLSFPVLKGRRGRAWLALDVALALLSLIVGLHFILTEEAAALRGGASGVEDFVYGMLLILLVLEGTRRAMGLALPIIAVAMMVFAYLGPLMPDLIRHRGIALDYIVTYSTVQTEGIWGVALAVTASTIIYFIVYGAFLFQSGGGALFIDLANALFGTVRGGPAKLAVVASGLFGTISGSAPANVVGTGTFTIPLMKKVGYHADFAGAVEAVASSGGQIMPPVMVAAAFIMADILGIPYLAVCVAAALPAILYYLAAFVMVDLEAAKRGLRGVPRSELPPLRLVLLGSGHLLLSPALLIFLLAGMQYSPMLSAFWTIVATVILASLRPATRMGLRQLLLALEKGMRETAPIAVAAACIGIVIGMVNATGLGLNLSNVLVSIAGGNLFVLLLLTMVTSLILGMGLPTVACYVILAILVAPALVSLGVDRVAAHLFVFYFGIISAITPPVAMAAYVAAGISGGNFLRTGFIATRLAINAFLLPFMFVYNPALILKGPLEEVVLATVSAIIGTVALGAAVQGYALRPLARWERVPLLVGALALIHPGLLTDLMGYALVGFIGARQVAGELARRRAALAAASLASTSDSTA